MTRLMGMAAVLVVCVGLLSGCNGDSQAGQEKTLENSVIPQNATYSLQLSGQIQFTDPATGSTLSNVDNTFLQGAKLVIVPTIDPNADTSGAYNRRDVALLPQVVPSAEEIQVGDGVGLLYFGSNTQLAQQVGLDLGEDRDTSLVSLSEHLRQLHVDLYEQDFREPGSRPEGFNVYWWWDGAAIQQAQVTSGSVVINFSESGEVITGQISFSGENDGVKTGYEAYFHGLRDQEW